MKLSTVSIENFGARSNLSLQELSEHLNVIYGPNGSGKSTIINFVRWVLYGNLDGTSRRYLANGHHRSGGSLTIANEQILRQTIHRYDDGSPFGKVSFADQNGVTGAAFERARIAGVDLEEFLNIFCLGFDQTPQIETMLQTAASRGFDFTFDEAQMRKIQELTEQLTRQQSELHRYPQRHNVQHLRNRQAAIHQEIAKLEQQKRERLAEIERRRHEILAEIDKRRVELQNLQGWLGHVETTIQARRQQLEVAAREAEVSRTAWIESRRKKVEEIDYQIQQWHNVLDSIRKRYSRLKTRLGSVETNTEYAVVDDDSDLRYFMRTLGYRVDDIEQDFVAPYQNFDPNQNGVYTQNGLQSQNGRVEELEYLRSVFGTALNAMRDDVSRLTETLRGYKASAQHNEYENEIRHLRRVETELTELIETLTRQRDSLMSQPDRAHYRSTRLTSESWTSNLPTGQPSGPTENYATNGGSIVQPWYESRTIDSHGNGLQHGNVPANGVGLPKQYSSNGNGHFADTTIHYVNESLPYTNAPGNQQQFGVASQTSYTPSQPTYVRGVDPVLEARLHHLYLRRDQVIPRVRELEGQITNCESQLTTLDNRFTSENQCIEQLRRELTQIDEQMRLAEEYARMQQAIRFTEEEIARLRQTHQPSGILLEASGMLRRMTEGNYTGIAVNRSRQITVEDAAGHRISYGRLNRGARDHAHLAVCLALVSAYHRRGVVHPLILNDIFVNIDTDGANATSQVLAEFARHGHQLLVFTRHAHVMHMFGGKNAKIFSLGERRIEMPIEPAYVAPIPPLPERMPMPTPIVHPKPQAERTPSRPPQGTVLDARYDWVTRWEGPQDVATPPPTKEVVVRNLTDRATNEGYVAPTQVAPTRVAPTHVDGPRVRESRVEEVDDTPRVVKLDLRSPIGLIPTIDHELISQFQGTGVHTVAQFLQQDPEEIATSLSQFGVTPEGVYRWQSEVLLQLYADVDPIGSQILAECGIDDPEELSMSDAQQLFDRVRLYLSSDRRLSQFTGYSISRSLLASWIEAARRANYQRRNDRWSRYSRSARTRPSRQTEAPSQPRPPRLKSDRLRSDQANTKQSSNRSDNPPTAKSVSPPKSSELRFYLELNDPIVDAPSIGPKTAERFQEVGVATVLDLLEVDPNDAAVKINFRRITADVIREWQLQTSLVCQVPNLRGHDAQILVACEVTSPEDLARADASTLYKAVKRFCNTTEGKRVLRNSKKPDMQEVSNWITWAEDARELVIT